MALLSPDYYYSSVRRIDLETLSRAGVRVLLMDLDNTVLPRDNNVVPDEMKEWAAGLRERGFSVCLVSNNWHERVRLVAAELGFALVDHAVKPLPFAFLRALRLAGATTKEAVVVGDQLFTDILGGKMLGMRTVLVEPLSQTDLPHTLLLRRLEALVLRDRVPTS
jgi:HAD superfamily phosphatase (TIGR01668 family)